jgi:hypothetical protein
MEDFRLQAVDRARARKKAAAENRGGFLIRLVSSKPSSLETFIVMRRYPPFAGLAATYSAKS